VTESPSAWAAWLDKQLATRQLRPVDLSRHSGGKLLSGTISKWRSGAPISPEYAIYVADLLGADRIESLRAAGHDVLADILVGAPSRTPTPPGEWTAQEKEWIDSLADLGLDRNELQEIVLRYREDRERQREQLLRMAEMIASARNDELGERRNRDAS
jgi:hypothetical protein